MLTLGDLLFFVVKNRLIRQIRERVMLCCLAMAKYMTWNCYLKNAGIVVINIYLTSHIIVKMLELDYLISGSHDDRGSGVIRISNRQFILFYHFSLTATKFSSRNRKQAFWNYQWIFCSDIGQNSTRISLTNENIWANNSVTDVPHERSIPDGPHFVGTGSIVKKMKIITLLTKISLHMFNISALEFINTRFNTSNICLNRPQFGVVDCSPSTRSKKVMSEKRVNAATVAFWNNLEIRVRESTFVLYIYWYFRDYC